MDFPWKIYGDSMCQWEISMKPFSLYKGPLNHYKGPFQWEIFRIQLMEVLYHMFGHIFWGYSLKFRPNKIGLINGRYLQFRFLK